MRTAVVDIAGEWLAESVKTIEDHGLRFVGALGRDRFAYPENTIRLIVVDDHGIILPEQCSRGVWLVRFTFRLETYGKQRMSKVERIDVDRQLVLTADGMSEVRQTWAA